ncbi:PAS domain-containing protein [Isoptericola sp. F-RaC21]|uniref:PAS domain-containing protein n=1 Tax=Isoptericola sp. F-RaC21 TaxID=3141452 RepID=UPI00315C25CB
MGQAKDTGRWVVIDARGPVLLIDDENVKGLSHRSQLGSVGARLLFPALVETVDSLAGIDEPLTFRDEKFVVRTRPLIAPYSGEPVGAMGIVTNLGEPTPEPPQVGVWEWVIEPAGAGRLGSRSAYWDETMSDIYGDESPDPSRPRDVSAWYADRLTVESRGRMADLIEQGARRPSDELHILSYTIKDDDGLPIPMRLAARAFTDDAGRVLIRGISHVSRSPLEEVQPTLFEPMPEVQIADFFKLDPGALYMAINLDYGTFERWDPAGWRRHKLLDVSSGMLTELVHPEDHHRLGEFVELAGRDGATATEYVRMAKANGAYMWTQVTAGTLSGFIALRQVLCRVVPVPSFRDVPAI